MFDCALFIKNFNVVFIKSYGITEDEKYAKNHGYVWKGLTMMGGVYLFYLVEKIMKIMILRKKVNDL
jgi:hypothetical protein